MSQMSSQLSQPGFTQADFSQEKNNLNESLEAKEHRQTNQYDNELSRNNGFKHSNQLNTVMSELNRLSKSFVDSYQTLEGQVEQLNGQLENETQQKNTVIEEKQKLLGEKAFLSDRLQSLLAIMPAGVVVIDGEGRVKDCNAKAVDILGRPLLGELWINVINRVIQPQADDGHQVSLKDGRKIHIETRALDVEPGQLVMLTDLTKSRQLQAELTQQNKLNSMGKMIASLAHQIRTPLSAAILYGSQLNSKNIEENIKQRFVAQMLERLHFMERQINDMLGFIRGERKQKHCINPKELFEQLKLRKNDFPNFVHFDCLDYTTGNQLLFIDQDAMIGAISNLIENAIDACQTVATPQINVVFRIDQQLHICVEDNGVGISAEQEKQIFEPFYTTKKSGNGLGLAIVHGIVIEHGGRIRVDSKSKSNKKKKGTCFEVLLPITNATENQPEKSAELKRDVKVSALQSNVKTASLSNLS